MQKGWKIKDKIYKKQKHKIRNSGYQYISNKISKKLKSNNNKGGEWKETEEEITQKKIYSVKFSGC